MNMFNSIINISNERSIMNLPSLKHKYTFLDKYTDEEITELCVPSIDADGLYFGAYHYVNDWEESRIDRIANLYYSSDDFVDIIMFYNNRFNPFSIAEGTILSIPYENSEDSMYKTPDKMHIIDKETNVLSLDAKNSATQYSENLAAINNKLKSKKDLSREERLAAKVKDKANAVDKIVATNMLQPGQRTKTYKNGRIYFDI